MIITIDGPAGSGKSTTAKAVARALGFRHLDSGAFYRALTLAALRAGIEPARWPALTSAEVAGLGVEVEPAAGAFAMRIQGTAVDAELRTAEVTGLVSTMARVPAVRDWLLAHQRAAAQHGGLVTDGRDMGTVVFPDADLKIYLTAAPAERALRRLRQEGVAEPDAAALAAETARLGERDRVDSERPVAPLRPAEDAVALDTTGLDFAGQVAAVVRLARERGA